MDFKDMDRLLHRDHGFAEFLSQKRREREISTLNARIQALETARDVVARSSLVPVSKKERKSAKQLCFRVGWTEEDAATLVATYNAQQTGSSSASKGGILTGIGRVGQAIMLG